MPIKNSYVLGAAWLNPLGRNAQDALTLGLAYNRLSDKALGYPAGLRDSETVLELQWVWGIGRFVTLTPDLQIYPKAAAGERHGLTTVIGLRTTVMLFPEKKGALLKIFGFPAQCQPSVRPW